MKLSGKENSMINREPRGVYKIINELKFRALASLSVFMILFGIGLSLSKSVINYLIKLFPFHHTVFIQTSLTESWTVSFKIALLTGIIFSFPFIVYNIISFKDNILQRRNLLQIYAGIFTSYASFFAGMFFACNVIIITLIYLLYGYGTDLKSIATAYSLNDYITFCLDTIIITGFSFAMPATVIYGAKTRILNRIVFKKLFKLLFISIAGVLLMAAFINHLFKFIILLVLALLFYKTGLFICKLFEIR